MNSVDIRTLINIIDLLESVDHSLVDYPVPGPEFDGIFIRYTSKGLFLIGEDISGEGGFYTRDGDEGDGYFDFIIDFNTRKGSITDTRAASDSHEDDDDLLDIADDYLIDFEKVYGNNWKQIYDKLMIAYRNDPKYRELVNRVRGQEAKQATRDKFKELSDQLYPKKDHIIKLAKSKLKRAGGTYEQIIEVNKLTTLSELWWNFLCNGAVAEYWEDWKKSTDPKPVQRQQLLDLTVAYIVDKVMSGRTQDLYNIKHLPN